MRSYSFVFWHVHQRQELARNWGDKDMGKHAQGVISFLLAQFPMIRFYGHKGSPAASCWLLFVQLKFNSGWCLLNGIRPHEGRIFPVLIITACYCRLRSNQLQFPKRKCCWHKTQLTSIFSSMVVFYVLSMYRIIFFKYSFRQWIGHGLC